MDEWELGAEDPRGAYGTARRRCRTETELSASCQGIRVLPGMRDAAAKLLSRAQDAGAIRPDLTVTELLCVTNGIAVAAEQRPPDTPRLLTLLIEGLQQHA
ncbi:hypothetical protein F8568_036465 [Actinomadura sp. LD22]|uniref:Transcriptional regulator SbtR-like C-terminal domain-containing protein n=1 Tax=Actinomadura physcomitrii TaxID=2650748 RepID=A0A6I4MSQ1_9ACTN|nr:hypothetical protein [Actinomadura physcomitrii]MWA05759.1 hypothetical protein [Actinomadura physcomitrii]